MDHIEYESSYYQVDTFEQCARKWGWEALDGVKREKGKGALFGIAGHGLLKDWLANRTFLWDQPASKVAAEMAKLLPVPQKVERKNVEMPFGMALVDVKFIGDMDLFVPAGVVSEFPRVYDHKFTRDLKWALPPESMVDDVQATLYAAAGLLKTGAREIEVQWTYGKTEGAPKAQATVARLNGKMIRERIERSIETSRSLRLIREAGLKTLDLPYNAGACQQYGGCPFRGLCNLTPEEEMESVMAQGSAQDSYLEQLKARKNGQGIAQPVNAPAASAPAVVNSPAPPPAAAPGGTLAALQARRAVAVQAAVAPAPAVTPVAQAVVVESPAPPAPVASAAVETAAAEKPARGPGRPKSAPLEERWAGFMQASAPITVSLGGDIGAAGQMADDMLKEYLQRFGS